MLSHHRTICFTAGEDIEYLERRGYQVKENSVNISYPLVKGNFRIML